MKLELGDVRSEPARATDPRRYHEAADPKRPPIAERLPVCLYLEVTNRCNLLCTTCPRTYEHSSRPPTCHGISSPHRRPGSRSRARRSARHRRADARQELARAASRHLKERGVYVLFNTNGTRSPNQRRALIASGLDEFASRLTPPTATSFARPRHRLSTGSSQRPPFATAARPRCRLPPCLPVAHRPQETLVELGLCPPRPRHGGERSLSPAPRVLRRRRPRPRPCRQCPLRAHHRRRRRDHPPRRRTAQSLGIASRLPAPTEPGTSSILCAAPIPGRSAAGPGRSCTSPPTGGRCPAASPHSPSAATRTTRSATQPRNARRDLERRPLSDLSCSPPMDRPPRACGSCGLRWSL